MTPPLIIWDKLNLSQYGYHPTPVVVVVVMHGAEHLKTKTLARKWVFTKSAFAKDEFSTSDSKSATQVISIKKKKKEERNEMKPRPLSILDFFSPFILLFIYLFGESAYFRRDWCKEYNSS